MTTRTAATAQLNEALVPTENPADISFSRANLDHSDEYRTPLSKGSAVASPNAFGTKLSPVVNEFPAQDVSVEWSPERTVFPEAPISSSKLLAPPPTPSDSFLETKVDTSAARVTQLETFVRYQYQQLVDYQTWAVKVKTATSNLIAAIQTEPTSQRNNDINRKILHSVSDTDDASTSRESLMSHSRNHSSVTSFSSSSSSSSSASTVSANSNDTTMQREEQLVVDDEIQVKKRGGNVQETSGKRRKTL
jgi:hypothetical protein